MIREATSDDIPRLIEMGTRFLTESEYSGRVLINPAAMARTFALLMTSDSGALFVSVGQGEHVTGMIGFLVFEHPLTGELAAQELFWWIDGEHRGGRDSLRLLSCGEQWAQKKGAVQLHMIAPAGSRVGTIYRRRGYQELEVTWQLDLKVAARHIASAHGDTVTRPTDALPPSTAPGHP